MRATRLPDCTSSSVATGSPVATSITRACARVAPASATRRTRTGRSGRRIKDPTRAPCPRFRCVEGRVPPPHAGRSLRMPTLHVILASTRPGRAGEPIADWFVERARDHGAFDVELIDLAEVALPFFDEASHPRLRRYEHQHTKDWSAKVDAGDAFVFVTPEYNYGYPAPLKNAIDFLHFEWQHKPVAFVSYGGVAGGTRAGPQPQ